VRDPGRREHTKHMLPSSEGRLPVNRCRKLSCSTPMMAPVRTRCCRDYFVRFVRTGSSAVSRLARCGCRTRGRGESGD
jgi:hypothetical protein